MPFVMLPAQVTTYSYDLKALKLHNAAGDDSGFRISSNIVTDWKVSGPLSAHQACPQQAGLVIGEGLACLGIWMGAWEHHAQAFPLHALRNPTPQVPVPPVPLQLYIIQEYCDAGSLRQAVLKHKFWDEKARQPRMAFILEAALELASGLKHLHRCAQGVVCVLVLGWPGLSFDGGQGHSPGSVGAGA